MVVIFLFLIRNQLTGTSQQVVPITVDFELTSPSGDQP